MNHTRTKKLMLPIDIGTAHGRFQPLHLGHMEYLLAAKNKCRFLVIGITNPDKTHIKKEVESNHRHLPFSNPLSYYERMIMIRNALVDEKVPIEEFAIVPCPIDVPEVLLEYLPSDAVHFVTIYDDWGYAKKKKFESIGFNVHILWTRKMTDRVTEGRIVRQRIIEDKPWEDLVPKATVKVLKNNNNELIKRIKKYFDLKH